MEDENPKVDRKTEERADWKKSLEPWGAEQMGRMADYDAKAQRESEVHWARPGKMKTISAARAAIKKKVEELLR